MDLLVVQDSRTLTVTRKVSKHVPGKGRGGRGGESELGRGWGGGVRVS